MGFKENILQAFAELSPKFDLSKAQIENDKGAIALSTLLSKRCGLALVEYIAKELDGGKKPLFFTNNTVNNSTLTGLIEKFYSLDKSDVYTPLIHIFNLFDSGKIESSREEIHEAISSLAKTDAIEDKETVFRMCQQCHGALEEATASCPSCGCCEYFEIDKLKLSDGAKKAIKDNQFLEIYAKICMQNAGIELIGWPFGKNGEKAYTSIRYQVDGDNPELDVHGIAKPLGIIFCEAKTVPNITQNELRKVENTYDTMQKRINALTKSENKYVRIFITTGRFDGNISLISYQSRSWVFIEREQISNLENEFIKVRESL